MKQGDLSRWAKIFLPKSLFGRSLLIITMPLILLQVVLAVIFFDRHWDSVTRRMVQGVGGDIQMLVQASRDLPDSRRERLWDWSKQHLRIDVKPVPATGDFRQDRLNARTLTSNKVVRRALEEFILTPFWIDSLSDAKLVFVTVDTGPGEALPERFIQFGFSKKRISSPTTYIFMLWMVGTSIVLTVIAVIFMRNQVKPIKRLANAAWRFGHGIDDEGFRATGASEVRQAATAFLEMRERINHHIQQRTDMLAGVSHDLRTPLTRMKLELALLNDEATRDSLGRDIRDMERLIEGYLEFARNQQSEESVSTSLGEVLREVLDDFTRHGHAPILVEGPETRFPMQHLGVKRAVTNLVKNALRHAENVRLSSELQDGHAVILVDDDGPGIPEEHRIDVFNPFKRLDESRNLDSGGVGLGLSIVRDVVRRHGGTAVLEDSPLGGLRARITLPLDREAGLPH